MWKDDNKQQFQTIVGDLLADPDVLMLDSLAQHQKNCTRLDHCLYVSYLSFLICRRLGLDHEAAARAGLLHDFHFGDEEEGVGRIWRHPYAALCNAQAKFNLSVLEQDIIVKHMWPLTRPLPRHRESFVVSLADKMCALAEMSRLYRLFRVKKHLAPAA